MDALMEATDFSKSNMNLEQTRKVLMEKKCAKYVKKRKLSFENSTLPFRFLRRVFQISDEMQYLSKGIQRKIYDV